MKRLALGFLALAVLGCQQRPAPLPSQVLAPGDKTANHTVELSMPHAFMPYAQAWAECDHWIHMDFDAMHENIMDLKIKREKQRSCEKAMRMNPSE